MSVYIGPCNYGSPELDSDDRFIRADEPPRGGESFGEISVDSNLAMKYFRIINLQSENNRFDAATVGYVSHWINRLSNSKVDWTGGTMTGDLNMGTHKLKQPGHPEDEEDVINKRYFDRIVQHTKPYDFERYIVFPHSDGTGTFHGAGSKRDIDLENGKMFNDKVYNRQHIDPSRLDRTLAPIQGKEKVMFHLDSLQTITADLSQPWTFVFSVKPYNQPNLSGHITLYFVESRTGTRNRIENRWDQNTLIDSIGLNPPIVLRAMLTIDVHHCIKSFCNRIHDNTLVIWVNGVSRKTHDLTLPALYDIELNEKYYGL